MENQERRSTANMERHIQTILISLCTGAIVFAANYVFSDKSEKAVLATQMTYMAQSMVKLEAEIKALNTLYSTKIVDMEARLRILELTKALDKEKAKHK